ncbi:hypothetical protein B7H01_10625 [Pandoraea apista]|nr:hypothetical protein B7H01_10625 [Pandoraea apista]
MVHRVLLYSLSQFASRQDIGARNEETISAITRTAKKEALLENAPTALFILRFAIARSRLLPRSGSLHVIPLPSVFRAILAMLRESLRLNMRNAA